MRWISTGCLLANASLIGINIIKVEDIYVIINKLNAKFRSLGYDAIIEPDTYYALDTYPDIFRRCEGKIYIVRRLSYKYVSRVFNGRLDARIVKLIRDTLKGMRNSE